jgi:radical SAM/Cys-rich protein
MIPAMTPTAFTETLAQHGLGTLTRGPVLTLQVNVGRVCNQACHHCHVEAGPLRTESMTPEVAARVVTLVAASPRVGVVDITGGAPELCPVFRDLVTACRGLRREVIDRCNLTVLLEPGQEDLAEFLAGNGVQVIASLPCYLEENVDRQRGGGVYAKSVEGLKRLNALGYGRAGSGLRLDLVYNPGGTALPPEQARLEADYREQLGRRHGIVFDRLLTLTNMPIGRFAIGLEKAGGTSAYVAQLAERFNPRTVEGLMCRTLVSVGHDGRLFDCDFNQMLGIGLGGSGGPGGSARHAAVGVGADAPGAARTVHDIETLDRLDGRTIATATHCFGCTAGAGSSCAGALD